MKVCTANIKNNPDMPDWQVRSDMRKIKAWKWFNVIGWQEIGEAADHRAIDSVFASSRFYHLFKHKELAVTVRRVTWTVLEDYYVAAHGGMAGVSPNRGMTVDKMKQRVTGKLLAVINTHFVSGAWYGEHSHQTWRRDHWNIHWAKLKTEIEKLNNEGYTVITLGDFNRHRSDMEKLTPTTFWAAFHGYDHIIVSPASAGTKVQVVKKGVYRHHLFTDHAPVFANLALS